MASARLPLFYTFGNHNHWVDMQWLWGYFVMPATTRDMLRFCRETGTKGNVNFDGIGYEKMAAEAPEALQELRQAVDSGTVEPVGCSYGQPYGLFHGGESNIRQRVYGVRTVWRHLGFRPRTFWEEEFDFFPQLPQILSGVGFKYASLFFQWTWHTPELPREDVPAVWWVAPDGSKLLAATRNRLNLHQWPEDMDITLRELAEEAESGTAVQTGPTPIIQQWVELIPSPDWMCRSELLLPKMKELLNDARFDVKAATLSGYLSAVQNPDTPERRYSMDDVWHGMSLGKNGDFMRRLSRRAESTVLASESLSAMAGLFGRPYAQWDVYPTWELEESWRELLQAQHHDNEECEGLCGYVGKFSYDRSLSLSGHIKDRTLRLLAKRVNATDGWLVYNPLGWARDDTVTHPETGEPVVVRNIPPMGYRVVKDSLLGKKEAAWSLEGDVATGRKGQFDVRVESGRVVSLKHGGKELLAAPLLDMRFTLDKTERTFAYEDARISDKEGDLVLRFTYEGAEIEAWLKLPEDSPSLDLRLKGKDMPRLDGGLNAALTTTFTFAGGRPRLALDQPYGISEVEAEGKGLKKYPTGDWMTSPQWFEEVHRPFNSQTLVSLSTPTPLLLLHDGSQQWFRDGDGIRNILTAYDPWDEDYFIDSFDCGYRLIPHDGMSPAEMRRKADEFNRPVEMVRVLGEAGDMPPMFAPVELLGPANALITAFYRETEDSGEKLDDYAGRDMGYYPYVLRLAEFDGREAEVSVRVFGEVASARRSNLLGEVDGDVQVQNSVLKLKLRPHEITTVYMDIVEGRKQVRDLDAKRKIWATVHRVE